MQLAEINPGLSSDEASKMSQLLDELFARAEGVATLDDYTTTLIRSGAWEEHNVYFQNAFVGKIRKVPTVEGWVSATASTTKKTTDADFMDALYWVIGCNVCWRKFRAAQAH